MEGYESKIAFHPSTHFLKKKTTFLSSISRLFIHGFRRHWKVRFFHRHSEGGSDLGSSSSQSFRDSSPFDETLTLGIQPVGIQPLRASPFEFRGNRAERFLFLSFSPTFSFAPWRNDFIKSGISFSIISLVSKTLSRVLTRFSLIRS